MATEPGITVEACHICAVRPATGTLGDPAWDEVRLRGLRFCSECAGVPLARTVRRACEGAWKKRGPG